VNPAGRLFVLLVVVASWAGLAAAQQQPAYGERIEVHVTTVDVVVTDAGGNFVHGLRREDCTVLDDGKPQALTNFAEYRGDDVAAAGPAAPPPGPAVTILILLDQLHLRPASRERAVEAVKRFVGGHMAGDVGYVLGSFDGTLHIHHVRNDAEVAEALSSMAGRRCRVCRASIIGRRCWR
jgi:VWFA-related protein